MKAAVVTGAGSGVGRAAALALGRAGFAVALAGRRREALEETAGLMGESEVLVAPTDVADEASVAALFARTEETFGRVDLLFNNAGTGVTGPTEELDLADWRRVVDVNLTGAFLCAREAVRVMKRQTPKGGRIINNGSVSAQSPRPDTIAYTATKHAITGLTKCLSLDGRKHDIACGQIDIGNAETAMAEKFKHGVPQASGDIRVEPVMDVAHVGDAVGWMASLPLDANVQFITIMATKMPYIGRG